jgi:hypothetical protein
MFNYDNLFIFYLKKKWIFSHSVEKDIIEIKIIRFLKYQSSKNKKCHITIKQLKVKQLIIIIIMIMNTYDS